MSIKIVLLNKNLIFLKLFNNLKTIEEIMNFCYMEGLNYVGTKMLFVDWLLRKFIDENILNTVLRSGRDRKAVSL